MDLNVWSYDRELYNDSKYIKICSIYCHSYFLNWLNTYFKNRSINSHLKSLNDLSVVNQNSALKNNQQRAGKQNIQQQQVHNHLWLTLKQHWNENPQQSEQLITWSGLKAAHPFGCYSITSQKLWGLLLKLPQWLGFWFLKPFTCIDLRQPQEAKKRQLTVVELNSKMARIHRPSSALPPIPTKIPPLSPIRVVSSWYCNLTSVFILVKRVLRLWR